MAELMHTRAMARLLKVDESWVKDEALAGRLPHVAAGDRLLFDPAAVVRVLKDRAQPQPTGEPTGPMKRKRVRASGGAR